jgi:type II secretory pathway predicted ATPase ExeA
VWGPSGAGKSALREKIKRDLLNKADGRDPLSGALLTPVIDVEAPTFADEPTFYDAVLEGLQVYRPTGNARTLQNAVYDHLAHLQPWAMLLDEIHNLNSFFGVRGQICLNAIRRLCNVHGLTLICFGTAAAQSVINADEQLEHRFTVHQLRPLDRAEFELFVRKLTATLGLKIDTRWTTEMVDHAYELTDGYAGRAADLVQDAAVLALENGSEAITDDMIRSTELVQSLQGRDVARRRAGRGRRR